jgi:hypothetical protein
MKYRSRVDQFQPRGARSRGEIAIFPKRRPRLFAMPVPIASDTEDEMILRLWRGWTTPENADRYEELIQQTIFPGILARTTARLEGLELFRRPIGGEVEFMTLMRFASWDAVKAFAGPNWEVSVVPPAARAVLARFDEKPAHHERRVAQDERKG